MDELLPIATRIAPRHRTEIDRARLREAILWRTEAIVLLEAPAGMGKSVLLAQLARMLGVAVHAAGHAPDIDGAGPVLWDIPPGVVPEALPETFAAGRQRIVIAKRPETALAGLARASLYGHVHRLGTSDLLFGRAELLDSLPARAAERWLQQSSGWPMLAGQARTDDAALASFLASELLEPMPAGELVAIAAWLDGETAGMPDATLLEFLNRVQAPLRVAVGEVMARRLGDAAQAAAIAAEYVRRGKVTDAIVTYQSVGRMDEAFAAFVSGAAGSTSTGTARRPSTGCCAAFRPN